MKKAKVMLASVAVVAVVAGASAFTAKAKFGSTVYRAPVINSNATIPESGFTMLTNSAARKTGLYTAQFNALVTATTTIYSQP